MSLFTYDRTKEQETDDISYIELCGRARGALLVPYFPFRVPFVGRARGGFARGRVFSRFRLTPGRPEGTRSHTDVMATPWCVAVPA